MIMTTLMAMMCLKSMNGQVRQESERLLFWKEVLKVTCLFWCSLHHRQNYSLVKSVCKTALKSLFWAPPVYQDLTTLHDWPVKNAIVCLPIKMKKNSNCTSSNSSSLLGPRTMISALLCRRY